MPTQTLRHTLVLLLILILVCLFPVVTSCVKPFVSSPPSTSNSSPPLNTSSTSVSSPRPLLVIPEISQSTEQILRHYAWDYGNREWTLEIKIPQALYDYYKEIPRPPTQNYSVYVTHPSDDAYISDLVDELKKAALQESFDDLETVAFAAAFVQSFPYTPDSMSTTYDEYPRYPIETLVDSGGDCEDTSILAASLLYSLGYTVSLITFPDKHCAVGVSTVEGADGAYFEHNGDMYFYLETTDTGWQVGQIPEELKDLEFYIYDMTPTPILTHEWNGTIQRDIAELEITVNNLGSQSAENVYIVAGFDGGEGKLCNAEESETFDLSTNQTIRITMRLQTLVEKHTRIMIQIIHDGYAVDESYSQWFES